MNATDFSEQTHGHRAREGRGAQPWESVDVPVIRPDGWFIREIEDGLREIERVRRQTEAAMALLVAAMPQDRDTTTALSRKTGTSNREARQRHNIAKVVNDIPGALELLRTGKVSGEHLAALAPIADRPGAAQLLAGAETKSPETLARDALQFKLSLDCGNDAIKRQQAQRFVRFSDGPERMVAIHGLLPPLEGTGLKTKLAALVNARYKAEHPERARVLGGHAEETRDQRTADAPLELTGVLRPSARGASGGGEDHLHDGSGECPEEPVDSQVATVVQTAKPAHVIIFNVDQWEARLAGGSPVPVTASLFDQTRHDLYLCFTDMIGEPLKFGRARRYPTMIQSLAVATRDEHCTYPGCHTPPQHCEIHHTEEVHFDHGRTDVDKLVLLCPLHHQHLHANNLVMRRGADGTIHVHNRSTGEQVAQGP